MEKKDLKPASVFHYFEEICRVPRPSKKEEKIRNYLVDFAKAHALEYKVDEAGNVLISKPATAGMENLKKSGVAVAHGHGMREKITRQYIILKQTRLKLTLTGNG